MSDNNPEGFAQSHGAKYREDVGWGHMEGPMLVHCSHLCRNPAPHGKFTRWVIQSEWEPAE